MSGFPYGLAVPSPLGSGPVRRRGIAEVLLLMAPFAVAVVLLAIRLWQQAALPVIDEQEPSLVTVEAVQ